MTSVPTPANRPAGRSTTGWLRRPRLLPAAAVIFLAVLVAIGGYALYLRLTGNFHTVIAGELYRSAQPNDAQIARYVQRYGIRTIINLRGVNATKPWYRSEVALAKQLDVAHIDFGMYSREVLTQQKAEALIAIFRTAQKPILIHCDAGADRSGLAAALYVAAVAGRGEVAADAQISIMFGHFGRFLARSRAIDVSWERLKPWLGF